MLAAGEKKKSSSQTHPPRHSLSLPSVCAQQFQSVLIFFPSVCQDDFKLYCRSVAFHFFWHFNWLLIAYKQIEGQPFFVDGLKILLLLRRPYRYFSIYLKVIYACLIATRFWIEVCQNAVFSKITITTIKKTLESN